MLIEWIYDVSILSKSGKIEIFLIKHKHHTHELYNSRVLKGVVIVSLDLTITAHLPPSLFIPGGSTESLLIAIEVTYKSGL